MTKQHTEFDKYLGHQKRTTNRKDRLGNPIQFLLTFEEWSHIWAESGHAHERGKYKHNYVMSRRDDLGHYEVGNVFIQTAAANWLETAKRGHLSPMKGKRLEGARGDEIKAAHSEVMKRVRAERHWSTKALSGTDGRKRPLSEEHKAKMKAFYAAKRAERAA